MYKLNGVPQVEPSDVKSLLDPFLFQVAKTLGVSVPLPDAADDVVEAFKKVCLQRIKSAHDESVRLSWIESPDRMGQ